MVDRRCRVIAYIIWLVALLAGLWPFFAQKKTLQDAFHNFSLPAVILINLIGLVIFVPHFWSRKRSILSFVKRHRISLFCVFGLWLAFLAKVPNEFRVLSDEANLISVSQSLLQDGKPTIVTSARFNHRQLHPITERDPKRPIQFSTLLLYLHSFTGYNYQSAFYLNNFLLLAMVLLLFTYMLKVRGVPLAWLAVLLFFSQPAYILTSFSAGFDFFALFVLFSMFVWAQNMKGQLRCFDGLWVFWGVIAFARYEYILFSSGLLCIYAFVHWASFKEYLNKRHLQLMFGGLLVLPRFYQHVLTSTKHAERWSKATLSPAYLPKNLQEYFRATLFVEQSPYNFIVSYSLIVLVLVSLIYLWKNKELKFKWNMERFGLIGLFLVIQLLYLCHYFGKATHPAGYRLYLLPTFSVLVFVFMVVKPLPRKILAPFFVAAISSFLYSSKPVQSDPFVGISPLPRATNKIVRWLESLGDMERTVIVVQRPGHYSLMGHTAINFKYLNSNMQNVKNWFASHHYDRIIAIQRIKKVGRKPDKNSLVPEFFKGKVVKELHYNGKLNALISEWHPEIEEQQDD